MKNSLYENCNLCARRCSVNRLRAERGYCGASADARIVRAAPHMWEEPIISGVNGSGTVFFSSCSLGCIYCQNSEISHSDVGLSVSAEALAARMLSLQEIGVHNVNFVTPTHYIPTVREAVIIARASGLKIPTVYNTASYETPEALKYLDGIIDIYLADLKYHLPKTAKAYSHAENYPSVARAAIAEMHRQQPKPHIESGLMKRGVIVRILLLPSHVSEAKLSLKYLYDTYGSDIYVSLMNQYTPMNDAPPPLNRTVTHSEYEELLDYARRLGVTNAFVQEEKASGRGFIPDFDLK